MATIRTLPALDMGAPATFFVGENGSGKSTLLGAIAAAADLRSRRQTELGSVSISADETLTKQRELGARLRLSWAPRTRDGIFMRAEDFFGYLKKQDDADFMYDDPLSHGEGFMRMFGARVSRTGIYILDEPEAPLSPKRQIELLHLMIETAAEGAQFVVATHSPVLLAFPGANIYSFDESPIRLVPYNQLEHVTVLRDFLNHPERYLP